MRDAMPDSFFRPLTPEEEADFRQWARDNWKPGDEINGLWHPVVRDEIAHLQFLNSEAKRFRVAVEVVINATNALDAANEVAAWLFRAHTSANWASAARNIIESSVQNAEEVE